MFYHRSYSRTYLCPKCGRRLTHSHELFYCEEHGSFFIYGSQLLVRVSCPELHLSEKLLPWEVPNLL